MALSENEKLMWLIGCEAAAIHYRIVKSARG